MVGGVRLSAGAEALTRETEPSVGERTREWSGCAGAAGEPDLLGRAGKGNGGACV